MNESATATNESFSGRNYERCAGRMNKKPWSIYEVGAVIGGFALFWPLGLVALFVKLKKGELWSGASNMEAPWSHWSTAKQGFADMSKTWAPRQETGNAAFDDYRKAALDKLEAERRKLDEERQAFDAFLVKLRKAKDLEAFERFMAEHKNQPTEQ